jgi:hypothetical protein
MLFDTLTSRIRQEYVLIFNWHRENGHTIIEKIIQANRDRDSSSLEAYKQALNMPHPENATSEEMFLVAQKVQSGILEWNYQAKVSENLVLGDIARNIIELFRELKKQEETEKQEDNFYAVIDYHFQSDSEYFHKAEDVYKSTLLDNEKNIGGRVALADTNWEVQKLSDNVNQTFFRKPVVLNFEEVTSEEDNLFQLAYNGKISITNISIK